MPIYVFPTKKPGGRVWEGGRKDYLAECIKEKDSHFRRPSDGDFICNAIARANLPIRIADEEDPIPYEGLQLAPYFPWLTLVLGSGCVTETVDTTNLTPVSPRAIVRTLIEYDEDGKFANLYNDIETFSGNIIRDRLGHDAVSIIEYQTDCRIETALLTTIACIATIIYRKSSLSTIKPLAWRLDDTISVEEACGHLAGELKVAYIDRLFRLMADLEKLKPINALREAEKRVISRIKKSLSDCVLSRLDTQILTEFSWLSMTEGCQIYHGWSDLISLLAREEEQESYPPFAYPPRPSYNSLEANKILRDRYISVCHLSWKNRRDKKSVSKRHEFFNAAAQVLAGQSKIRENRTVRTKNGKFIAKGFRAPVATAFSTSFDVELEMALADRNDLSYGFTIVLPVYYVEGRSGKASLQWLGADIPPGSDVEDILSPRTDRWKRLSGRPWFEDEENSVKPYIIHLAGTPLIELPRLEFAPKLDECDAGIRFTELLPAILLNEYEAIQHHGTEMFQARAENGDNNLDSSAGLPDQFTAPTDMVAARFWLMMGVQMDDPAVRYKLATRLGPGRNGRNAESLFKTADKAGLVVTSKLDPAAKDLLGWYGVDMVVGACTDFQKDLEHYALHLDEKNVHKICRHHEVCEVRHAEP